MGAGMAAQNTVDLKGEASARRQTEQDREDWDAQNKANRPDVNNVYGGQHWETDPTTGQSKLTTSLSGDTQSAANSLSGQYADLLKQGPMTGDKARDQAINSAYGQATSRLDPQWDKRMEAQRTQLLNQGLDPSSEAGKNAMSELGMQRNDAYSSAMNNAIGQGTAAGDSVFRNNQSELAGLLGQMQGVQGLTESPKFNAAGERHGGDWVKAQGMEGDRAERFNEAGMKSLDNGVNQATNMLGGLAGKSDIRFKKRVRRLAKEALPGVHFATWEWKGEPGKRVLGVIAQDLEKVAPQYVHKDAEGMRWVDYSFLQQGESCL